MTMYYFDLNKVEDKEIEQALIYPNIKTWVAIILENYYSLSGAISNLTLDEELKILAISQMIGPSVQFKYLILYDNIHYPSFILDEDSKNECHRSWIEHTHDFTQFKISGKKFNRIENFKEYAMTLPSYVTRWLVRDDNFYDCLPDDFIQNVKIVYSCELDLWSIRDDRLCLKLLEICEYKGFIINVNLSQLNNKKIFNRIVDILTVPKGKVWKNQFANILLPSEPVCVEVYLEYFEDNLEIDCEYEDIPKISSKQVTEFDKFLDFYNYKKREILAKTGNANLKIFYSFN